jgi:hypothetical protein
VNVPVLIEHRTACCARCGAAQRAGFAYRGCKGRHAANQGAYQNSFREYAHGATMEANAKAVVKRAERGVQSSCFRERQVEEGIQLCAQREDPNRSATPQVVRRLLLLLQCSSFHNKCDSCTCTYCNSWLLQHLRTLAVRSLCKHKHQSSSCWTATAWCVSALMHCRCVAVVSNQRIHLYSLLPFPTSLLAYTAIATWHHVSSDQ